MTHILDALATVPETWLVVGKGPSYDPKKISVSKCPICCLNETSNLVVAAGNYVDLCLMNDRTVLSKLTSPAITGCELFAIANGPHHFAPPEEVTVEFLNHCAQNLAMMNHRLKYFDLRTCSHSSFPDHPKIQAHFSVYETALWILGYAGAKHILTTGVDGGRH